MRLFAQYGTRTGGRNRPLQRGFDGFGFALFRHDANHFFRRAERWDGKRQRTRRNGFQAREIPFTHLLAFAGVVEPHDFNRASVVEIGHGRIVESQVAVFADAEAAEVNRLSAQQLRVAFAFFDRTNPHRPVWPIAAKT